MDKTIFKILIIDDDKTVCQSLKLLLSKAGYEVRTIFNPQNAVEHIQSFMPDLILLDMNFSIDTSGDQGIRALQNIQQETSDIPVILITGWGTLDLAVRGMKNGAVDFITKPWDNQHLLKSIQDVLHNRLHRPEAPTCEALERIIGVSASVQELKQMIEQVAPTDATVLITGASGTGKELVAEAIHDLSARISAPFVKVNLGGLTASLFESELFGHKKGAFTGAIADRIGRFEMAEQGTIFLDEVGDLALDLQVKLLRVLQEKTYEPVGSSTSKQANVRVISATHRPLMEQVQQGTFREDLYYRLNLLHIHLPSLNERSEDIPHLAKYFIERMNSSYGSKELYLEEEAGTWLSRQNFPGNIRQLKNLVERTWLLSKGKSISIKDFQNNQHTEQSKHQTDVPSVGSMTLEEMEKIMIVKTIAHYNDNYSKVAHTLGITRSALYRRLDKYGISRS